MTNNAVQLVDFRAALQAACSAACTIPVYRTVTPATVDKSKPWIVLEFPPGGQSVGNALTPDRLREVVLRVRAVASDPNTTSNEAANVEDAAQWAADQVAAWLATPTHIGTGWVLSGARPIAHAGIDRQGDTVNIVDDYLLLVGPA